MRDKVSISNFESKHKQISTLLLDNHIETEKRL